MHITNNFVFIHRFRTGGTYIGQVLRVIYSRMMRKREISLARRLGIFLGVLRPPVYIMTIFTRCGIRELFKNDPDKNPNNQLSFCVYSRPRRFFGRTMRLLSRIHKSVDERIQRRITRSNFREEFPLSLYKPAKNEGQHDTCRHIPDKYLDREIVSVSRNPFDHYVSWYENGNQLFNLSAPSLNRSRRKKGLPEAEKPNFEEFVKYVNQQVINYRPSVKSGIGPLSIMFIRYYSREPEYVLRVLSRDYVRSGQWRSDSYPVTFLPQENLTPALREFLARKGIEEKYLPLVKREKEKELHVTRKGKDRDWRTYYTPELTRYVREREWFLFEIFPEYEITSGAASI